MYLPTSPKIDVEQLRAEAAGGQRRAEDRADEVAEAADQRQADVVIDVKFVNDV